MKQILKLKAGLALAVLTLFIGGCSQPAAESGADASYVNEASSVPESAEEEQTSEQLSAAQTEIAIEWNGDTFTCSSSAVEAKDYGLKITQAGTYRVTGTMNDGQIRINPDVDGEVTLILDQASLNCSDSAPLYAKKGTSLTLELSGENTITDGAAYTYETAEEDEPNAALFCKDNLTIRGSGSLSVQANYNNGIGCKGTLTILGGTLNITAANHAVKGKEAVLIEDGSFNLQSAGDGIHAGSGNDDGSGTITIRGGDFSIVSAEDGIQAEQTLTIAGGTFDMLCGEGADAILAQDVSAKALKGLDIVIEGGEFTLNAADDTVHANQTIRIQGAIMELKTGDDGIHADEELTISGGRMTISQCREGLEAAKIYLRDGEARLTASDDGINAADGSGSAAMPGWNAGNSDIIIEITGGLWVIDAAGDGLDSNGSVEMSGGTVLINGPVSSGDGALDYDGSFSLTGGTLAAASASGMAQNVSSASNQGAMLISTGQQSGGTLVYVQDEQGETLLAFAPSKAYGCIVISSPQLQEGGTYTVYVGGSCDGSQEDGLYAGGNCTGGSQAASVTLSSLIYSGAGTGMTEGMGGRGGFGGMNGGHGPQMPDPMQNGQMSPPDAAAQSGGSAMPPEMPQGMPDSAAPQNTVSDAGAVQA